ncbi:MAG: DUF1206 domain-containing protein, partial [Acidobacteria bacterium]|nr:DUF1206 domain-containing protein [Acidobacteriota bacterium]
RLSRLGFYTKGFLFIVVGAIALMVVFGLRGRFVDATGALEAIAREPFGAIALIAFVVGGVGHGLWNILRGAADVDGLGRKWHGILLRCIAAGTGIFYLGLAATALELVLVSKVPKGPVAHGTWFSVILEVPIFGAAFVGLIGLGLVGAAVSEAYNGLSGRFRRTYALWKIGGLQHLLIRSIGVLSFTARAVLLAVMGWYFLRAAFRDRLGRAIGLDMALHGLVGTSYGPIIVTVAAIGLIGHGVLAFYEAKYRRIS